MIDAPASGNAVAIGAQGSSTVGGADCPRGREIKGARMIDVHPTVTRLPGIEPGRPVDGVPLEF